MTLGLILAAVIIVIGAALITLLVTGKTINIHITHTQKDITCCSCNKETSSADTETTQKLQEAFNKQYTQKHQEPINMDGVIAEVNKVMGIEVPNNIEGDK